MVTISIEILESKIINKLLSRHGLYYVDQSCIAFIFKKKFNRKNNKKNIGRLKNFS